MDQESLAVYVHWPYCARICPYCDFNVYKAREKPDLVDAIVKDLAGWRAWSGPRRVHSIHFGGGTPSLMQVGDVARIMTTIASLWTLLPAAEIAMEANPSRLDPDAWRGFRDAGISRLSLGVQSFDDVGLQLLGRDHDRAQAERALDIAGTIFPSVSLDLIFGWAGQSHAQMEHDMSRALRFAPEHISTYQLTIEPGTAFARAEDRGVQRAVDPDHSAQFYDHIRARLTQAGYDHYEVSNFAKAGHMSRHNLTYWQGGDYVGVGPGAHGRLTDKSEASSETTRYATVAAMRPQSYINRVASAGLGLVDKTALSPQARAEEYLFMGLRVTDGISMSRYADLGGDPLPAATLSELISDGLMIRHGDYLRASASGRLVLNSLIDALLIA